MTRYCGLGKTRVARGVNMNYKKHKQKIRKMNKLRLYHWRNSAKFHEYYGKEMKCKTELKILVNKV